MARMVLLYAIALGLAVAGLEWLTRRHVPPPGFERNAAAICSLGLTPRECEILAQPEGVTGDRLAVKCP